MASRRLRRIRTGVLLVTPMLALTACASSMRHDAVITRNGAIQTDVDAPAITENPGGGAAKTGHAMAPGAANGRGAGPVSSGSSRGPSSVTPGDTTRGGNQISGGGGGDVGVKPAPAVPSSQGVTSTTIKLGAFVASYEGLEAKGLNLGNAKVQAQAVADYINDHGGIAGRKVVLTFATMQATSSNWEADEQKICTQFTEDDHVFAVVYSLISMGKALLPCLAQHNTPLIAAGGGPGDADVMRQFPNYYIYSGGMNLTRMATTYVDRLAARGYFDSGAKIGLVRGNDASFGRAASALESALARHGQHLTQEAVVDAQTSVSGTASQMPSVVLKMQQAGVNRVLFLDNATLAVLFAIQASSQGFYPRYGLSSLDAPATLMEPNVPSRALAGSVGVGWIPTLDVSAAQDPDPNAAAKLCRKIMVAAGEGNVSRAGENQQRLYCDGMFFLQRALARAAALTPAGLVDRMESLGSSYMSSMTFGTQFAPGRHDGASQVRDFIYSSSCTCFQYAGAPRAAT